MDPAPSPELRVESRCNMFVIATMYAGAGSAPVRLRNMSRTGALIEGQVMPTIGSQVRLSRGSLTAVGDVIWAGAGRAGLRFNSPVTVNDWIPLGKRGSGQQLIDEIVHRSRLSGHAPATPATVEIADEMVQLKQILERVGEELSFDSAVSNQHGPALQMIDAVVQGLSRLALTAAASLPPSARVA